MHKLIPILLLLTTHPLQAQPLQPVRALIIPAQQATLSAPVSDEIRAMHVAESDPFQQGDLLITFNCDTSQARIKKAQAELTIQQRTLQTQRKMQQMQSVSTLEVDISAARTEQARAELEVMQAEAERCQLRAPFNGRVSKRHAHPFESVKRGDALIEIINHQTLIIEMHIPSSWLRWVAEGTPFTLTLDETGSTAEAAVSSIGSQINPVSQTIKIKGTLKDKSDRLLSGMSGTAQFSPATRYTQPDSSVTTTENRSSTKRR